MRKTEKRIKALRDMELKTPFGVYFLSKGEVKKIRFKNAQTFRDHLEFGNIVEVMPDEEESKVIPTVLSEAEGDGMKITFKGVELPCCEILDGSILEESKSEITVYPNSIGISGNNFVFSEEEDGKDNHNTN